jgi:hypothetical protein
MINIRLGAVANIPATWEAEIWRIVVQGQMGQKLRRLPSPKKKKVLSMVACTCHPSSMQEM